MERRSGRLLAATLLLLEHLGVKVQFLPFQNVTVAAAGLSGSGGDASQQTARAKGIVNGRVQCAGLLALRQLSLQTVRLLGGLFTLPS